MQGWVDFLTFQFFLLGPKRHPRKLFKVSIFYHRGLPGLIIRSSVFQAIHTFFVSERAQEWFTRKKEWIAPIALLSWAIWANCSWLLFCNERTERLAHGPLFKKSDVIESLMSLFKKEQLSEQRRERRATGAICLGHTKRKNCQKQIKNTIFYIFFISLSKMSNLLESQANHSYCSFFHE